LISAFGRHCPYRDPRFRFIVQVLYILVQLSHLLSPTMAPSDHVLPDAAVGSKRKTPMTSSFKSVPSIHKRAKPDDEEDDNPAPSTPIALNKTLPNGGISQVDLNPSIPVYAESAASPSSSIIADKAELMKDGGFTQVMSKEEKRKEKKRLKEAKARQVRYWKGLTVRLGFSCLINAVSLRRPTYRNSCSTPMDSGTGNQLE
jgi:hypothetical protein